jgi:hypothetical protein
MMTHTTLIKAREIVRQLSTQEKLSLLNDITAQLMQEAVLSTSAQQLPFPVLHVDSWPQDLPLRREDLYDDRGR